MLAKDPAQITLLDIVLATDGPFGFASKGDDSNNSGAAANIPNLFWGQIADEVSTVFEQYSLKDMVERAVELGIPRGEPGYMYFI